MEKVHQEKWKDAVETHWWAVANHTIAKSFLHNYLRGAMNIDSLDIGCSNGKITEYLLSLGSSFGIDISFDALLMCKKKGLSTAQADAAALPFKERKFDVITLFDVAEHVEDDEMLFREINRVTRQGGRIFIMVPAHMALWGSHDAFYGHRRRYVDGQLKKLAGKTGFKIVKLTYLHPLLFPVMFLFRFWDRMNKKGFGQRDDFRNFGWFFNKVFEKNLILDGYIARYLDYPFGTTIFSVWKKL